LTTPVEETIALARASELLRQQAETFDQRKAQDRRWHIQRLAMGWMSCIALPMIGFVCGWIIFSQEDFSGGTVTVATTTLFVDTIGLVGFVWRGVFGKGPEPLTPVTSDAP
jgi:hypothetical protein